MSAPHGDGFSEFAEELKLLAEAVLERVEPVLRRSAAQGQPDWSACSWCPVCAAAALVRGEHHDVVAAIADHGTAIVTVLREALAGVPVDPLLPTDDPETDVRHRHPGSGGEKHRTAGAARSRDGHGGSRTGDRHDAGARPGGRGASRSGDRHGDPARSTDRQAAGRPGVRSEDEAHSGHQRGDGSRSDHRSRRSDTARPSDQRTDAVRPDDQRTDAGPSADQHPGSSRSDDQRTARRRDQRTDATRSTDQRADATPSTDKRSDATPAASQRTGSIRSDDQRADSARSDDQRTAASDAPDQATRSRSGGKRSRYVGIPVTIKA
ncbi:hypothetical protein [Nocardia xishanensis]|uniref:hypothetical protein n=1 Tax=Nocardia xishanensis TaxID=238964 RepID=UPI003419A0C4